MSYTKQELIENSAVSEVRERCYRFANQLEHAMKVHETQKRLKLKHRMIDKAEEIRALKHTVDVWSFVLKTVTNRISELHSETSIAVAE